MKKFWGKDKILRKLRFEFNANIPIIILINKKVEESLLK